MTKLHSLSQFVLLSFVCLTLFAACQSDDVSPENQMSEHKVETRSTFFTTFHDNYCDLICDSISVWRGTNMMDEDSVHIVWDMLHPKLATTLGITSDSVETILANGGITVSNFYAPESLASSQDIELVDSVNAMVLRNWYVSDAVLIDSLADEFDTWRGTYPDSTVDAALAIATSSYVYWRNNIDPCVTNGDPISLTKKQKLAIGVAAADVLGAVSQSWWGLAGILIGAVYGSLGNAYVNVALW